jgi:hypothetical protein
MNVHDRRRERGERVVVALDGEDATAAVSFRGFEDDPVRHVAAGEHGIGGPSAAAPAEVVDVGEDEESHGSWPSSREDNFQNWGNCHARTNSRTGMSIATRE